MATEIGTNQTLTTSTDVAAVQLGEKLRNLRQEAGQTLQALALDVGVSQSMLSQVERGLTSPSITTLRRLAAALNVPVAAFFVNDGAPTTATDDAHDGQRIIVRRQDRKGLRVPRSNVVYELLTPDLNRKVEFLWIEYTPGSVTHPEPMSHPGEENALCLEGSVVVTVEGSEFVLNEGDSISFDSGRPHQVENRGNTRAVLVSAITPPSF
jgi:transcriptional regulator with XRE-family HTH domain